MKIEVYSPTVRRREMDAVLTAMVEDRIGPGEQTQRLVQLAKEYLRFDYCLALRSPAIALYIALKSMNLPSGAGVVVSALSPKYYAGVIEALGLKPIFCDVNASSAFISAETITEAIGKNTDGAEPRCIVVHHALGFVPNMAAIAEMGIPIIEDCSRSYGTLMGGGTSPSENAPGSFGVFAILGLEERDVLTAGGGALLYAVNRRDASVLRNLGDLPREYGLPDMNAAMAMIQFKEAAKNLEKRKSISAIYVQAALRTRHKQLIQVDEVEYNAYAFPLVLETGMKDVIAYAKKKEIAIENAFDDTLIAAGIVSQSLCPEAYSLSLRTALFPLYPRLSATETAKVSKLIGTLP
ncbi:MAG: DegT/DnrJ/EryC1/StrS family aminotransferase [Treponema sp.]|jgi:dTDP-4-amino-4,6-dideoxygalactose transaminase|nr:DegT/DnrJ/EryC1/StrS family aminotransferase [Treponema sp.]